MIASMMPGSGATTSITTYLFQFLIAARPATLSPEALCRAETTPSAQTLKGGRLDLDCHPSILLLKAPGHGAQRFINEFFLLT